MTADAQAISAAASGALRARRAGGGDKDRGKVQQSTVETVARSSQQPTANSRQQCPTGMRQQATGITDAYFYECLQ
jgi:hypothetical protein